MNVTFTPVDDAEEEPDETLGLVLQTISGASPAIHFQGPGPDRTVSFSEKTYPITIVDDDFRVMGAATISGAPQVGQTLTAVTTGIRDPDGLTTANYMYQWIGVDGGTEADISSANSSTYTLLAADLGKTIKVRVTFTDDASNAETRTSVATATVIAAPPATCGVPDFGSRRNIWTGALTVEAYSVSGVLVAHGFDSNASVGALAPTTFHTGLNGYTVDGVGVPAGGTLDGDLQFGLTSDLTAAEVAALRLHVCDTTYDFSAANHLASNSTYIWADDLDWSGETTLTLYLSLPPAITIAADRDKATGKMDWILYTLNREGDTAAELTVTVILAGPAGNDWSLDTTKTSQEVTFAADSATATHIIRVIGSGFGHIGFSESAAMGGTLTARLGAKTGYDTSDTDEVDVVVTSGPAWVIKLTEDAYSFDEDGGAQDIELVATAASADMPAPSLHPTNNRSALAVALITEAGTAHSPGDYAALTTTRLFPPSTCSADPDAGNVQVCRLNVTFTPVDDAEEEPDETLGLVLQTISGSSLAIHFQGPGPDRTVSFSEKTYPITIVDDDFRVMGAATISGAPQVGQTLTAVTTGIRDPDGLTTANYMYQWIGVDGGTEADISSANSSTYTLLAADLGKTIKVRVTFTDDASNAETRTSVATATVIAASPATCGVPDFGSRRKIWTGALTVEAYSVSGVLVAHGFDSNASVGALAPTTFHTGLNGYTVDGVGVPAGGTLDGDLQFGLTSDLTAAEVAALRLHVCDTTYDFSAANHLASNSTYIWADDLDWSGETTLTLYLSLPANNPATGTPTITGTATVGQELTADASPIMDIDGLTGVDFTYQWIRVDADGTSNEEDISGEIAATYTLSDDDVGKKVKVKVSFTDELSGEEERTSAAFPSSVTVAGVTDVDEPPDAPATPAVTAVSGSTTSLTVSWAAPANAGRPDIDNYDVQYRAGTSGTWSPGPQNITTTTTTITGLVADTLYQARVRATNAEGDSGWSSPPGAGRTNALGEAQTVVLVSNTGQLNSGHRVVGADEYAQPFDTGNNSDGYSLTGIVLDLQAAPTGSGTLTITVREDSSGSPVRAALYTLANPALAAGLNEFLAPENAELHANTTYWVVATYSADTGGPAWYRTVRTDGLDAGAAAGWAIDAPYKIDGRVAQDDWVVHSLPRTLQIAVKGTVIGGANTPPTAADNTVATAVDTAYTFEADDFGFTDTDTGDTLASVKIVTLPTPGTLALDGTAVVANDVVTKAQIDGDMLTFTPVAGASGTGYASFTFKVNDGTDDSASAYTMTIDVAELPAITIAADRDKATGKMDWILYTLNREGDTAAELTVTVILAGPAGNDWSLDTTKTSQEVTFAADSATATHIIRVIGSGFGHIGFSESATMGGTLTARLGAKTGYDTSDTDEVAVAVTSGPAWVIKLAEDAYSFDEDGGAQDIELVATAASADMPAPSLHPTNNRSALAVALITEAGTAHSPGDYAALTTTRLFPPSTCSADSDAGNVQVCRLNVTFTPVDDAEEEPDETLGLVLQTISGSSLAIHFQGPGPDRTVSFSEKTYPITIVDDDFRVMGAATISGAPQVGQTLTAVTTGIRDPDGLTTANYMYQWIGVDGGTEADISSANSSTYTLLAADLGKTIKVRVTFTDDASNAETRTSVATATVIAASPATCGVPDFGSRRKIWTGALTVEAYSVSGVLVAHGFDSNASVGALAPTTFHTGLNGYTVDGVGVPAGGTLDGDLQFGLTSDLTAAEVAALRLHVCDTTYDFSAANHLASNSTYIWADDLDWSGETTLTLYLSLPAAITIAADRDKATGKMDWILYTLNREGDTAAELTVTVILAGPAGNDWSLDTTKTSQEVTFAADSATATHIIRVIGSGFGHIGFSESATMGGTLTARLGAKTGYDTSDTDEVAVAVTSGPAWVIKLAEDAYSFDEDGGAQDIELVATAASADMPAPSLHPTNNRSALAVALITEAGTAHSPGDYAALTTTRLFPPSTCSADSDAGNVQVCRLNVTFTPVDDAEEEPDETLGLVLQTISGSSLAIHFQGPGPDRTVSFSEKTYPITIVDDDFRVMGAATISGAPQVGQTLTAVTTGIRDPDGLTTANYMYQWIGVDGGTEADISSANSSTYTLLAADLGKTIKVRVTFTDDASNAETRTSVATATVIAASPATCGVPDFGSRRNIWTGALTVEAYSVSGVLVAHGFDSNASVGALAPTTFHTGLNGYTVDGVGVPAGGTLDGDLQFGLTSDLTAAEVAALRLHVCDTTYDFSAANHLASNSTYIWADDLDWSGETTLTLYLSLPAAITIAADRDKATGKMDWILYTLNREGDTAAELTVTVILAGPAGNDWSLDTTKTSQEVTFAADSATATHIIRVIGSGFGHIGFSESATMGGTLTARLGAKTGYDTSDTDEVAVAVTSGPAWVIKLAEDAYSFDEDGGAQDIELVATAASADMPAPSLHPTNNRSALAVALITEAGTAHSPGDYAALTTTRLFPPSTCSADSDAGNVQVCRLNVTFTPVDDAEEEPDETLGLVLQTISGSSLAIHFQGPGPDRTVSFSEKTYPITIVDDDFRVMGAATISGAPQVGQTLTAVTTGIRDPDGLTTANYMYQWIGVDGGTEADISSANSSTYTLLAADLGKTIKVRVTFTDDASNAETRTSVATATVIAASPATCGVPDFGSRRNIWTGALTVEAYSVSGVLVAHGFDSNASVGALAPTTFHTGLNGYTVDGVGVPAGGTLDGDLQFGLTSDLTAAEVAALRLHVCDTTYDFSAANHLASNSTYIWADDLDWSGETTLTLYLSLPAAITIAADRDKATGKMDWILYTLNREGDTAAELTVTVILAGPAGNDWSLDTTKTSQEVTFAADSATATHIIRVIGSGFGHIGFSESATMGGTLTARLGAKTGYDTSDTDEVAVAVTSGPAWVIKLAEDAYSFDEDGGAQDIELVATAASADMPAPSLHPTNNRSALAVALITEAGTAHSPGDYAALTTTRLFPPSTCSADSDAGNVQVCRLNVTFTPVDDAEEEPDETLGLVLQTISGSSLAIHFQGPGPDRTVSFSEKTYPITIVDDDFRVMGAATISGAPQVGQTLTAVTTGIRDPDGLTTANYMYQWIGVDGGTEADISSANSSTYTLLAADLGKTIKVRVTFTDDASNAETRTSVATATVIAASPATCGVPDFGSRRNIWTGALTVEAYSVSGVLVAHGFDSNASVGALAPTTFHTGLNGYTVDGVGVPAGGTLDGDLQFGLTSDLTAAEVAALRLHVCDTTYDFSAANHLASNSTYIWADDLDWSGETTLTLYLSLPANNPATGTPTITGTATVGQELTADASPIMDIDGLTGVDFTYQWIRVDADGTSNEEDISGEIAATYTLSDDDVGKKVKVKVSFTDELSGEEERTSAAFPSSVTVAGVTDVDEPPDAPATPAVTAVSGSTTSLTVSWAAPANAGRPDIDNYDVQYRAGTSGTWSPGPQNITTTTTTITGLVADTLYQARVRATNAEGDSGWSSPPGAGRTNALGEAQTVVLVSNTGQLNSGHRVVGADEYAQPFDTGNNSDGYSLTGIVLDLQAAPTGSGTLTITVREDSSGSPVRAALYTLANPALAAGLNEFLAPENAELHANTTYWVVATYSADTGGPTWYRTVLTYGLDAGAAAGWAIDAPYKIDGRVAQDDWVVHSLPRTLQIAVKGTVIGGANTPPTAADNTVATAVDTPYTFTADDFGFTDTDPGDMLASVRIVTVPTPGTLALDGTAVTALDDVTKAQIDGDMLTFTPVAGASGTGYASFDFKVNDGTDDSASAYTMTIDVTAIPAITIAADRNKATGKLDWVHYTLNREGDTAAELTVTVTFAGPADNDWSLDPTGSAKREVTFAAGSATAEQSIRLTGDGPGQIGFSLSATTSGALTARLGATTGYDTSDTDEVEVVVTSGPAWVIKLAEDHYRFDEDGGDQDIELVATAASADMPAPSLDPSDNSVLFVSIITQQGTAEAHAEDNPGDFLAFSATPYFTSSTCSADPNASNVQVCRSNVTFTPVDDAEAEPDETLELALSGGLGAPSIHFQGPGPDRTVSGLAKTYPATIVDDEFGVTGVAVTSTPRLAMDTYGAREHIELSVSFNKPVTVTGAPTFTFDLGGTTTTAAYQGGSGTRTLVFSHQVMPDDADTNGIAWAANALALAGGTIVETGGTAAPTLTVAVQSALSDHKVNGALTASGTATVSTVAVTSTPRLMASGSTSADTYGVDERIEFTVTFSAAVTVTGDPEFEFSISNSGGTDNRGRAAYASGSGTTALVFRYRVKAADEDTDGIWVGNQSRTLKLDSDDRILTRSNSLPASLTHSEQGTKGSHKVDGSRNAGTACAAPDFGTRRNIWTSTVDVEANRIGGVLFGYGFSLFAGSLADNTFFVGANKYTVDGITVSVESSSDGDLVFSLSIDDLRSAQKAALKLHVCDTGYDFADASYDNVKLSYTWEADLDWSMENIRTVYLSLPANNVATGEPAITGTAQVGQELTATTGTIADDDGLPSSFTYQWVRVDADGTSNEEDITDETDATYTLTDDDAGKRIKVKVSFVDILGGEETRTSAASGTVPGTNTAPVFSPSNVSREIAENTAAGVDIGAPVEATDTDGDTLTYTLGGDDADAFDIVESSGQIRTESGVSYDHEAKSSHAVTVTVSDGTATAVANVTISVTDVDEPPSAPATPAVSAVSGSSTSLSVSWAAPANAGKPDIASYDVQYRAGSSGTWSDGPEDVTGTTTTTTIIGLTADTLYEARVRATNAEGDSGWSDPPGSGRTPALGEAPPRRGFLVSNFGRPVDGAAQIYVTQDIVGVFTTGAQGADLHSIEFRLFTRRPNIALLPIPSVTLYRASVTDSRATQGERVAALTAVPGTPRSTDTAQTVAFAAPSGTRLEAGATYLVVLEHTSYVGVQDTNSSAQDAGGASGWTIDGVGAGNSSPYSYGTSGSLLMSVNGTTARAQRAVREEAVAKDSRQAQSAQPLPGAPRNFTVSAKAYTRGISQSARATLSWAAPANQGEALLERYEYRYAEAGKALPGRWRHAGASGLSETVKGLELRTGYVFELRAVNLEGPGPVVRGKVTTPAAALAIGLYAPSSSAIEGQALRIGARRPAPTDSETFVAVQVFDSAFEGARPVTLFLQFASGEATATGTMTVPFDGARPASRTLTATVTSVQRPYVFGSPKSLTFKVTDRDASVRVGDARVREGPQAALAFTVTLDRARDRDVTVEYATSDATARAGEDYTAVSGTLVFTAGERSGTVSVPVLDDAHDEGAETLTLRLFNARGAVIVDGVAEGTILNDDLMPDAWLSRFGRAASDQVVQSIGRRLEGGARESHLTVMGWRADTLFDSRRAGRVSGEEPGHEAALESPRFGRDGAELRAGGTPGAPGGFMAQGAPGAGAFQMTEGAPDALRGAPGVVPVAVHAPAAVHAPGARGRGGPWADMLRGLLMKVGAGWDVRVPGLRDMVKGSSFYYGHSPDAGPLRGMNRLTAWGEGASTRFSGAEGKLSLDGEVNTAIVGADGEWGRWLAGLALSYSDGEGDYREDSAKGGAVSSTLTGVNPYARYRLDERTSFWGTLGYGSGRLTLTPKEAESSLETDMTNVMAAFGGRGVLSMRTGETGQFELALRSDAMLTDTTSAAVTGLAAGEGATNRIRLILEGSGSLPAFGGVLAPKVEAGLRYDGGDAETGAGLEVGGGLAYDMRRLTVKVDGRVLLTHQDRDYEEWGYSLSFLYQPAKNGRGLRLEGGSQWGVAQSGVHNLWSLQNAGGLASGAHTANEQRYTAELGYGFGVRRLWYPYIATESGGASSRSLRFGLKLNAGSDLEAGLAIGRRAHMSGRIENDIRLQLRARW